VDVVAVEAVGGDRSWLRLCHDHACVLGRHPYLPPMAWGAQGGQRGGRVRRGFIVLLSAPVLVAGVVRLGGWSPRNWLRAAAWTGGWVAAIGVMYLAAVLSGAWRMVPALST
jgi:hypothetical protein